MAKFKSFDELLPKHKWNYIAVVFFALFCSQSCMNCTVPVRSSKSSVLVQCIRVGGFRIIRVLYDNIQVWLFPIPLCKALHGTFSIEHQVDNDKLAAHCNYQKIV